MKWMMLLGSLLIALGLWQFGKIGYFHYRSATEGGDLLQQAASLTRPESTTPDQTADLEKDTVPKAAGNETTQANAPARKHPGLLGLLEVPDLHLKAPIVEGTGESQIAVAVGHLSTSARPGEPGTGVLAGHNATWFRHLDQLQPGDRFQVSTQQGVFRYQVTSAKIVRVSEAVYGMADTSGIILETCYPLDAWRLTDQRYLVFAEQIETTPTKKGP